MGFIYKITNDVNDKIYIGKTSCHTVDERFKIHCADSKKNRMENRPLYRAMNKYGIEHFYVETIEECSEDFLSVREQYYIDYQNSYRYGYNATRGGDGKSYLDYDRIYEMYICGNKTIAEVANIYGCCVDSVSSILKSKGITDEEIKQRAIKARIQNSEKAVIMIDKVTNEVLMLFDSCREAGRFVTKDEKNNGAHISSACKGERKSAYGYKWKYA